MERRRVRVAIHGGSDGPPLAPPRLRLVVVPRTLRRCDVALGQPAAAAVLAAVETTNAESSS